MRIPNACALLAVALLAPSVALAQAKPAAPPKTASDPHDHDLPKAAPRAPGEPAQIVKDLPAFLGLLGPRRLIEEVGFKSVPGRFVEYRLSATPDGDASVSTMRVAEVGPSVRGRRWLEFTLVGGGGEGTGFKVLTEGEKDGNVQRLIVSTPEFPSMEVPLDSAQVESLPGMTNASLKDIPLRKVGREKITVPLGTFEADHWIAGWPGAQIEYWTAVDGSVPFSGILKSYSSDGATLAAKVGNDATARIAVPRKQ